jgi:hypothetical protein
MRALGTGGEGSTIAYIHRSGASRWARERILNASGIHARIASSAVSHSWKGRMLRVYLTSVIWNLKEWQLFMVLSPIYFSLISLLRSEMSLFSKHFWFAITKRHGSLTFERGFQEIQKANLKSEVSPSYIIPPTGSQSVTEAMQSILTQDFSHAEFEVIVVNDSGNLLYQVDCHDSPCVHFINTNKCKCSIFVMKTYEQNLNRTLGGKQQDGHHDRSAGACCVAR